MISEDQTLIKLRSQYNLAKDLYFDYLLNLYNKCWYKLVNKCMKYKKERLVLNENLNVLIKIKEINKKRKEDWYKLVKKGVNKIELNSINEKLEVVIITLKKEKIMKDRKDMEDSCNEKLMKDRTNIVESCVNKKKKKKKKKSMERSSVKSGVSDEDQLKWLGGWLEDCPHKNSPKANFRAWIMFKHKDIFGAHLDDSIENIIKKYENNESFNGKTKNYYEVEYDYKNKKKEPLYSKQEWYRWVVNKGLKF